jgi:uncharacterized protein YndB with AHSA1/START domain
LVVVAFPVPREVAFDYLVDPRNRAEWQSSLARVADVDGEPRVGQTWVDVTRPGLRPLMETTELDRPRRWTERGTWHGISAALTLDFAVTATGCEVTATVDTVLPLRLLAPYAVRADLRRAASVISQ